ncbi:MAG: CAAX prenyl protease-related protein [Cytophagales bacterium]|nr:CAAX prenyl protease-related protein [Armatimonadota bacterium]
MINTPSSSIATPSSRLPDWLPYVMPMALFLLLTAAEGKAPEEWYVSLYALKAIAVTAALLFFGKAWRKEIKPEWRVLPAALLVGLAVFAEWVLLDRWIPYPHLGERTAYNPLVAIADPALRYGFFALRFYGLVLMVPLMEEVFWRSFLLRFVTDLDDFKRVPLGSYSAVAFLVVAGMFAASHSEWLVAFVCAAAYAFLLRTTRSLFACIIAHAVTNLALGIYIVTTGDWKYW